MKLPLPFALEALALASASLLVPGPALSANARNPYGNVDRRVDAGNDTGNSQVDRLNEMQLDRNYRGPSYPMPPADGGPPGAVAPVPAPAAAPPPYPYYVPAPDAPRAPPAPRAPYRY